MNSWQSIWVINFVVIPILGIIALAFVVQLVRRRINTPDMRGFSRQDIEGYTRTLIILLVLAMIVVVVFKIIPTLRSNSAWNSTQQACAVEAGYATPADDNSAQATYISQKAYRDCLDR